MPRKLNGQRKHKKDSKCKLKSTNSQKKKSHRIETCLSKIDWIESRLIERRLLDYAQKKYKR